MVEQTKKRFITSDDLKKHNQPGDLWISIQGKVYDVSHWVKSHPGGEAAILNLAGQDVTDAFIAYHPGTAWRHLENLHNGYHVKDHHVSDVSRDYRRLAAEFSKRGLFDKKGHVTLYTLTCVALMLAAVVYGVVACTSLWAHLISAVLLGLLWIQSAYVGHDSGHYNVTSTKPCNKLVQLLSGNCITGISIAWWKWTHNAHHISCNSLDHDPDLQHIPVLAVSSKFFKSMTSQPDRALNIAGILVFWTWFPLLVSFLPNWQERIIFVFISMAVTAIQHVQFCLNHFAADVYTGPPNGNDWFEKQTAGTLDISCRSYMDWFFGGLQFQLEHHLFPRLPRCHLRGVSPVVQELCKKHNLPYRSLSWWEANVWTLRTLRKAAVQARDVTNPVLENLLWEALNTHG
uniref:Cytochrome b5 heme-binding domain-containing protein n=1 Tax=Brassica oleracea var. oleracea TaxID=109376 RepID=A0A0D3BNV8_BRAOL